MSQNLNETSRTKRTQSKKKRRWPRVLLVIVLIFASFILYGYMRLRKTSSTIHTDLSDEEFVQEKHPSRDRGKLNLNGKEPFSILLMGIDKEGEGLDRGRSDTMMVMAVNPTNKKTTLVSIPRDTRTEIIGKGFDDKINHAHAFGGAGMSLNTVQNLLDIPVDFFVSVNMNGIQQIVDAVGGISVTPTLSFNQSGYSFVEGQPTTVDGEAALAYSRMRKEDPEGDFGRQERQREVVLAILKKGASFDSILNFESVLTSMENNLQTNLEFNDMASIFLNYSSSLSNINQIQMTGEGTMINDIYYLIVPEASISEISSVLKSELEITE